MPSGPSQQIDRLVAAAMNAGTGDSLPGQAVSSGTGAQQYGGQVGARVYLDSQTIRSLTTVGTLFGGVYQYVYMTYTTTQPARGQFVSWDLSVAESVYQVNGDAKPSAAVPTLIAGVVLNATVVKGTWAWMQIAGRASCLFDSAITAAVAGNAVSPKVTAAVPSTFDVGAVAGVAIEKVGVAETLPVVSTISVVQLDSVLLRRI
jgi:hypothetical protein